MNPEDRQPAAYRAEETAPAQSPAYGYVIVHPDGTVQGLTGYDRELSVSNLPGAWGATDPQIFTPAQIRHGQIESTDRHENRHVSIFMSSADERMRRFLVTAAPVRIQVYIIRLNAEAVADGGPIDFETQGLTMESGILGKFGFSGATIAAELTPEVYLHGGEIPRVYFSRRCNHALFDAGCGLDRDAAGYTFTTLIASLDSVQREMVITDQMPDVAADFFSTGQVEVTGLGMNFCVGWSEHDGSDTKLKLTTWHPEFEVGQTVIVRAGCRHTVADCRRLNNIANFGGFPHVPSRNPTVNSIRA